MEIGLSAARERGELASIDAVPYVEALGLPDRRQSGRRRKPLPGGVDKGLSACNVRLRARRPTSLLYRRLCGEQPCMHRRARTGERPAAAWRIHDFGAPGVLASKSAAGP